MSGITPEEKRRIYEEEKVRLEAQQKLAKEKKPKQQGMGCLLVIILIGVIWISNEVSSCGSSKPSASATPATETKTTASTVGASSAYQGEKNYISSAGGYLQSLNEYGSQLGRVMAGASTGQSTLGEIKQEIQRVKSILDAAWYGDYQKYPPASPEQNALHVRITECRRLHDSGFKEMLVYWKDGNEAHLESGLQAFQRGVRLTNDCISDLNKITKALANKTEAAK
jgi:hypothetical protein